MKVKNEKMKTIKILDLDDLGAIEFFEHGAFLDSIQGVKFFDNGWGVSIICKCDEVENLNHEKIAIRGIYSTSCGRWEDGTFELAVIQGNLQSSYFVVNEFLQYKDDEYLHNDGIWRFKTVDKVKEIISMIKSLDKITRIPTNDEEIKNDKI
jgi:hypothetical protein